MGLPPGSSKFSTDTSPVTTFFYNFPNFTGSHSGVTATMNVNSIAGGGTGQTTAAAAFSALSPLTTAGDIIYENNTPAPARLPIGAAGTVLTVSAGLPSWVNPAAYSGGAFFASSAVTTASSAITSGTFTTFSNSPALSFTPTVTGTYKVYCSLPLDMTSAGAVTTQRIFNTSGSATLLEESQGVAYPGGSPPTREMSYIQSVYTLTAGTTYQFDIQALVIGGSGGSIQNAGNEATFYMFAEGVVTGTGALTLAAFGSSPNANGATISASTLTLQPASASFPGGVSTTTQTFAGAKTFSSLITGSAGITITGTSTLGTAAGDETVIGIVGSTAIHDFNGGIEYTTNTITANYTIDSTTTDFYVLCNQAGAITVTLPAPTNGRVLKIKDISGTAFTNNITIARHSTEKIENVAASFVMSANFESIVLISDGTNWWIDG